MTGPTTRVPLRMMMRLRMRMRMKMGMRMRRLSTTSGNGYENSIITQPQHDGHIVGWLGHSFKVAVAFDGEEEST